MVVTRMFTDFDIMNDEAVAAMVHPIANRGSLAVETS